MRITDELRKNRFPSFSLAKRKGLKKSTLEVKDMAIGSAGFTPSAIEEVFCPRTLFNPKEEE